MGDIHIHIHLHGADTSPTIELEGGDEGLEGEDLDDAAVAERLSHSIDSVREVIDQLEGVELYATSRPKFVGFRTPQRRRLGYCRVTTGRVFIVGVTVGDVAHLTSRARQLAHGVAMWTEEAPADEIVDVLNFARDH